MISIFNKNFKNPTKLPYTVLSVSNKYMRLEPKARVYYRLSLLINNSKEFQKEVQGYKDKLEDYKNEYLNQHITKYGSADRFDTVSPELKFSLVPDNFQSDTLERINTKFSIGINDNDRELALNAIRSYLNSNTDGKLSFSFKNDEININIKAPINKGELLELWDKVIKKLQLRFIEGYRGMDVSKFNEGVKAGSLKKFGEHKPRKSKKKVFLELDKKRWEEEGLSHKEQKEFFDLQKEVYSMDIFKHPYSPQNIDEDLLILGLYLKHGRSKKIAEQEYKKAKLGQYLITRDKKAYDFARKDNFGDLCRKYLSADEQGLLHIKNFDTRLRSIRELYMIE